jgi:hypothetical protein
MSYVTSAVIVVDYAPREVEPLLTAPQTFGRDGAYATAFRRLDDSHAGGSKVLQAKVYAAGLNHISTEALKTWFLGLPWGAVGSAVLVYIAEGDFRTVVATPGWEIDES